MRLYIVKDQYLHRVYLVNAESKRKACSKMLHSDWSHEDDSRLSDFKAYLLKDYVKRAEQQGFSLIYI